MHIKNKNNLTVNVYPNPVVEYFSVELNSDKFEKLVFELFDAAGRRVSVRKLVQTLSRPLLIPFPGKTLLREFTLT